MSIKVRSKPEFSPCIHASSRAVTPGGTLARDGRVQPGDYLVSVNEEEMRTISHSQALDILRRTHMVPLGQGRSCPISAVNARPSAT